MDYSEYKKRVLKEKLAVKAEYERLEAEYDMRKAAVSNGLKNTDKSKSMLD